MSYCFDIEHGTILHDQIVTYLFLDPLKSDNTSHLRVMAFFPVAVSEHIFHFMDAAADLISYCYFVLYVTYKINLLDLISFKLC